VLATGDGLESRFRALEGGSGVEDDLAALKRGLLAGAAQPAAAAAALPEGRPLRDAIDLELEDLRRKAKG
jgi:phage shock protein A